MGKVKRRRQERRGEKRREGTGNGLQGGVLRGAQGASHVALGKSGLHAHCEGERVIALVSGFGFTYDSHRVGLLLPAH